jgi:ribosome recycling factor
MIDQIIQEIKPKMKSSAENLISDLSKIRTGRANAGILDDIIVPYYGNSSHLREMASITIPEPTVISIKPWDKNVLADIETAIRASDLGLNPINDGTQIRLVLPPMTEERRKEIVSQVKKFGESAKVSLRNIRSDAWSKVQHAVKSKEATEDDKYQAEEELNKLILENNKEIDRIVAEKETEIMKI